MVGSAAFLLDKMQTVYVNLSEINEPQTKVMRFVMQWVKTEKTPVPYMEIINAMRAEGIIDPTTIYAIKILLLKGYIRRGVDPSGKNGNRSSYVQLRSI
ncbi:MAG: hypothetical protein NUV69_00640 [Candidatus Curtissbacteria bacterium]|nr:hypothetical protein [Candidatus Curtissbacteria bacterium]